MQISEISPVTLRDVSPKEVLSLHHRLHELWALNFAANHAESAGDLVREDVVNAHRMIVDEMKRRGMVHKSQLRPRSKAIRNALAEATLVANVALTERIMVVPEFVSLVGSTVTRGPGQRDADVLVRSDLRDGKLLIDGDNVFVPIRKVLDPEKAGLLHFILNPQGPHAESTALYDLMLVRKGPEHVALASDALHPITRYKVQKPAMLGYTDFVNIDEAWKNWAQARIEKKMKLLVSPKVDGLRTILQKRGQEISIWFEDSGQERKSELPSLAKAMQAATMARPLFAASQRVKDVPSDFIIEGELQARVGEQFIARPQLLTLLAGKLDATPMIFLYDLLFDDVDVSAKPFAERLPLLHDVAKGLGDSFVVLPQMEVTDRAGLDAVAKTCLNWHPPNGRGLPIEGIVLRQADMPYVFGPTEDYAKLKRYCELKFKVLAVNAKQNGFTYSIALHNDAGKDVPLGDTFVSKAKLADIGETLNVGLEELILYPDGRVATGKPTPLGPDHSRGPYTVAQAIDLARRFGILKTVVESKQALQEVSTRAAAATAFWAAHWQESYPPGGKGAWVYQHHWRGLNEQEADKADEAELLQTDHSVHGDLRLSFGPALWGFTCFLGTTADAKHRDLWNLPSVDALQGAFKLHEPKPWLTIARRGPYVAAPGGVGGTTQAWAKFFEEDHGVYEMGVWREHSFEIFLRGAKIRGRYLITFAPVGDTGARTWVIRRPMDQTPMADAIRRDAILSELRSKSQRWLIWAKPGLRPELIDVRH